MNIENKDKVKLILMCILLLIGTILLVQFNYYNDFIKSKIMTLEERIFLSSYDNFHYENGLWLDFYVVAMMLYISFICPSFFKNHHIKEKIIEKIKEGKKEYHLYLLENHNQT